jgi:hypothetical protein
MFEDNAYDETTRRGAKVEYEGKKGPEATNVAPVQ